MKVVFDEKVTISSNFDEIVPNPPGGTGAVRPHPSSFGEDAGLESRRSFSTCLRGGAKQPRIAQTHSHRPEFGEVLDFRHNKGSLCWASQLATRSMCRPNSGPPQRNTALSSIGFLWSKTFKVPGCSFFSAQTHVPRIPSAGFHLQRQNSFAVAHDVATWRCFTQLLGISCVGETQDWASLPFQMGGCGFWRSATRIRVSAHWASLRMIHSRHPRVAATMVRCLVGPTDSRHFSASASCRSVLREVGLRRS